MINPLRWSLKRWLITGAAAVAAAAVVAVGATFVYIHFIEGPPPKKLTLDNVAPAPSGSPSPGSTGSSVVGSAAVDGVWKVSTGSLVGYRVKETLFGQSNTAVGRTSDVTGQLTVSGTTVSEASFTTKMSTVTSDQNQRDSQFRGRIMEVNKFPTSTFVMAKPLELGSVPEVAKVVTHTVSGKLTLHGVTKDVTIELSAKRSDSTIAINGEIPVTFADYSISNPSGGPASVGNTGTLEVLLVLTKA